MIDVAAQCNLECPVCYWVQNQREDVPLSNLKKLAQQYRGKIISLSGGEPTLRADLPEIIRLFSRHNTVFLITNGLRLADRAYLERLRESGLRYISFSFNGFSDSIYKIINGKPLLDLKLKALQNIKQAQIQTILSVLLVKGLNENELSGILQYCLQHQDFIRELRIRTMVPVSKHLAAAKFSVDELLALVCQECSFTQEEVLREQGLKQKLSRLLQGKVFAPKDCSFDFHLKTKNNTCLPVGHFLAPNDNLPNGFLLLPKLLKAYGLHMLVTGFLKFLLRYEKKPWIHGRNIFKIGLRSWPAPGQVDKLSCQTGYYLDGEILPFCYAIALKDNKSLKERCLG